MQPNIPDSYGGNIPGAPGTFDVNRNCRQDPEVQKAKKGVLLTAPKPIVNIDATTSVSRVTILADSNGCPVLAAPVPKSTVDINAISSVSPGITSGDSNGFPGVIARVPKPVFNVEVTSSISPAALYDDSNGALDVI